MISEITPENKFSLAYRMRAVTMSFLD